MTANCRQPTAGSAAALKERSDVLHRPGRVICATTQIEASRNAAICAMAVFRGDGFHALITANAGTATKLRMAALRPGLRVAAEAPSRTRVAPTAGNAREVIASAVGVGEAW